MFQVLNPTLSEELPHSWYYLYALVHIERIPDKNGCVNGLLNTLMLKWLVKRVARATANA